MHQHYNSNFMKQDYCDSYKKHKVLMCAKELCLIRIIFLYNQQLLNGLIGFFPLQSSIKLQEIEK